MTQFNPISDPYPYQVALTIILIFWLVPLIAFSAWFLVATWLTLCDELCYRGHMYLWRMGWRVNDPDSSGPYFTNTRHERFGD